MAKLIGVLSDTHGLLRTEVAEKLSGCDLILHAGDIGSHSVLVELERISEVIAVRGNVDRIDWARGLKESECLEVGGKKIYLIHDLGRLALRGLPKAVDIVIFGHSHRPSMETRGGILYLNPGSAGPQRFNIPVSMVLLKIRDSLIIPEFIEIQT
ncbi:MAG: metallophosphoesterase family protein [bacterium]